MSPVDVEKLIPLSPEEAVKHHRDTGSYLETAKTLIWAGDPRTCAEMTEAWNLNEADSQALLDWFRACWAVPVWKERREGFGRRRADAV